MTISIELHAACEDLHDHTDNCPACHGDHVLCPEGQRLLDKAEEIRQRDNKAEASLSLT